MGQHTHLHLNVQRTMIEELITQDMERAFAMGADTIGMCELETPWHHTEFASCARRYDYQAYLPALGKRGSDLGLAVRASYGNILSARTTFCAPGKSKISPTRYINTIRIDRHSDRLKVNIGEHHAYDSGFTGRKTMDVLRKARWYMGMKVVQLVERGATKNNDLVIGGGDLNRPPHTFTNGVVLPALLDPAGMKTSAYAHTDGTHGNRAFDYVWALSSKLAASFTAWSTPEFNSDHDGIIATVTWS